MRSPHNSYRWRGERVIEPIKCMHSPHTSYRWREERVIEPIKCMRSPHTSYRWRGERVIEPIKCMGVIRRPWLTKGQWREFGQDTPTLYEKCHGIFNDHRESGPRFNVSLHLHSAFKCRLFSAFNPSKCTYTWSCGARGAVGGSVPCSRVSLQSWTIPAGAEIQTHNLELQVQRSIH